MAAVEFEKIIAIEGEPASNARAILGGIVKALQAVLDGTDPDEALGLYGVNRGPKPKPENLQIALMIEIAKHRGDRWSTIESLANTLLTSSGRQPVSLERLKKISKAHGTEALRLLQMAANLERGAEQGQFQRISEEAGNLLAMVHNLRQFVIDPRSVEVTRDA